MPPDPSLAPADEQAHVVASNRPIHTQVRTLDYVATQFLLGIATDGTLADLTGAGVKILLALVGAAEELTAEGHLVAIIRPLTVKERAGIRKSAFTSTMRGLVRRGLVCRQDPPCVHDPARFELISPATGARPERAPARQWRAPVAHGRAPVAPGLIDARVGAGARGRPADAAASAAAAGPQDDPAAAAERLEREGMNRRTAARLSALPDASLDAAEAAICEAQNRPADKRLGLIVRCLEDQTRISQRSWERARAKLAPKREAAPSADALDNLRLQRELAAQAEEYDRVLWSLTDAERGQLAAGVLAAFPNDDTLRRAAHDPMRSRRFKELMHAHLWTLRAKESDTWRSDDAHQTVS